MKVRPTKDTNVTNPNSHTTYSNLCTSDKNKRLHRLQQGRKRAKLYIERLKPELSDSSGVVVDQEIHDNLKIMVTEYTQTVHESYPEDSFKCFFWDQQQKASSIKVSKSLHWHPLFIKWCICLHHLSGSSYNYVTRIRMHQATFLEDFVCVNQHKI